jgi:lysozyme
MKIIKHYEGLYLESYLCPANVPTIGYGTTVYPNGDKVKLGDKITKEEAENYLIHEVKKIDRYLAHFDLDLNSYQVDSLISFIYNLGSGNFSKSTLLKKIRKNPSDPSIETEFMKWIYAGGKPLEGLRRRRKSEWILYSTGKIVF